MEQKVSIIIPIIRQASAQKCYDAIVKNAGVSVYDYEIVAAVDNNSIVPDLLSSAKRRMVSAAVTPARIIQ